MMSDFNFTPTEQQADVLKPPFYEDARADVAPYYGSGKTIDKAKQEVRDELGKLGAGIVTFKEGFFGEKRAKRYGYVIEFEYGGVRGVIRVAGLPMRHSETETKMRQVKVQALLIVRDQLKAAVTARVFSPKSDPLVQYLLIDGTRTVAEMLYRDGRLALPAPVVEGEIVE